jgi:hypothetical protein
MGNNNSDKTIEKIIYLMQTDKSVDAPQDAIDWSKNIFRTRAIEPKKSFVEKVFAVLQMDLSPNKAVFGERSASANQARQMLFEAGENSVDLRIKETEKGLEIRGQILGEGFENAQVKLGDFETETNELSEFKFNEIPNGKYNLILQSGEKEIVIEELDLN